MASTNLCVPSTRLVKIFSRTSAVQRCAIGSPAVVGGVPLGCDPALQLQAFQRRVQRSELDIQRLLRNTANRFRDSVAVERRKDQGPEHQHIEGALQ